MLWCEDAHSALKARGSRAVAAGLPIIAADMCKPLNGQAKEYLFPAIHVMVDHVTIT
jgi:hypothetical protein